MDIAARKDCRHLTSVNAGRCPPIKLPVPFFSLRTKDSALLGSTQHPGLRTSVERSALCFAIGGVAGAEFKMPVKP